MNSFKKPRGRPPHQDLLTPAEWRVINLAKHGLTNQQIADNLQVSINAIKYHITNTVEKLRVIPESGITDKKSLLQFIGAAKNSAFHKNQVNEQSMKHTQAINSIGQISRTVQDIKQSESWYRDTLGLNHLYTFEKLAFFDIDGVRLYLSESEDKQKVNPESIIYFKTSDIAKSHQQLTDKGIDFTHSPHIVHTHEDGTEEWMAFFNDLEGRPLGLTGQYK